MSDRTGRLLLVSLAVPASAYALWLLVDMAATDWVGVLTWLVAGVVLHDLVLAPLLLAIGVTGRWLPAYVRTPATVALVVWGSITLLAVPVLGRFGALEDNPTLLDRPYLTSWLLGSALTVSLVAAFGAWRARAEAPRPDQPSLSRS